MKKKIEMVKGFSVVGTRVSPAHQLGGTMPVYLENKEKQALLVASTNQRLLEFSDLTEQWLCEIIIKPLRKVKPVQKNECEFDEAA